MGRNTVQIANLTDNRERWNALAVEEETAKAAAAAAASPGMQRAVSVNADQANKVWLGGWHNSVRLRRLTNRQPVDACVCVCLLLVEVPKFVPARGVRLAC